MAKALSFAKLDLLTVKPYLTFKNLIILIGVCVVLNLNSDISVTGFVVTMCFGVIYSSYPFVTGEKNNIDVLYSTLSIKRDTVVLGRYMFALMMDISVAVIANAAAFASNTLMGNNFAIKDSLFITGILLLLFGLVQAVQIPIYFKLGYTKAKFLTYLPLAMMPVAAFLLSDLLKNIFTQSQLEEFFLWASQNQIAVGIFAVAVWVILMNISYRLSLNFYRKRDF